MIYEMEMWLKQHCHNLSLPAIAATLPLEVYQNIEKYYPGGTQQFEQNLIYEPKPEVEVKLSNGKFEAWAFDGVGSAYGNPRDSFRDAFAEAMIFLNAMMAGRRYIELSANTIPF